MKGSYLTLLTIIILVLIIVLICLEVCVKQEAVAEGILDLKNFESEFKQTFDIKNSVLNNLKIRLNLLGNEETIKKYIYLSADWNNLLNFYKDISSHEIEIRIYECSIKGLIVHNPDKILPGQEETTFYFEDKTIDKTDFLVTLSFNPRIDKHIEHMISQQLIDYGKHKWKTMMELR